MAPEMVREIRLFDGIVSRRVVHTAKVVEECLTRGGTSCSHPLGRTIQSHEELPQSFAF